MWLQFFVLYYVFKMTHTYVQIILTVPDEMVSPNSPQEDGKPQTRQEIFDLFNCRFAINRQCPDPEVTFYLYTKEHPENPESIRVSADQNVSNLGETSFDPSVPTKIIIHGFNSDMHLSVLHEITKQYMLSNRSLNVFTVDWSPLSQGPCYPAAIWNARHTGECTAQLVQRIRETGNTDIHVIGFSLGAHVTNHMAINLRPYKVPRITGLDPAMPGYITATTDEKLDKTDADYVDVVHTNAFMQGKVEESGHADFYVNGGVLQPGCWAENRFFACNHHRAPLYFAESINTDKGFFGWPCPSYIEYLLGRCPPTEEQYQVLMGDHINKATKGVYLVITESVAPYAVGQYTGPAIEILYKSEDNRLEIMKSYEKHLEVFMEEDNMIASFRDLNELEMFPTFDIDNMFPDDPFLDQGNLTDFLLI